MKVIELLSKIANGEKVPKFKYDGLIWKYSDDNFYWSDSTYLDSYCDITQCLNDEVEIIEEPKEHKIEKLDIDNFTCVSNLEVSGLSANSFEYGLESEIVDIVEKINEIIDYINKENK